MTQPSIFQLFEIIIIIIFKLMIPLARQFFRRKQYTKTLLQLFLSTGDPGVFKKQKQKKNRVTWK